MTQTFSEARPVLLQHARSLIDILWWVYQEDSFKLSSHSNAYNLNIIFLLLTIKVCHQQQQKYCQKALTRLMKWNFWKRKDWNCKLCRHWRYYWKSKIRARWVKMHKTTLIQIAARLTYGYNTARTWYMGSWRWICISIDFTGMKNFAKKTWVN